MLKRHISNLRRAAAATFALALVALFIPLSSASASVSTCYELFAGQNADAGQVCVAQSGTSSVDVAYTTSGWLMSAVHLAIGTELSSIPVNKSGNPVPGQFPYSETFSPGVDTYTFHDLPVSGFPIYVAAQAEVWNQGSETTAYAVSSPSTKVTSASSGPSDTNAVLADQPVNYPNCADYTPSPNPLTESVWNAQIGSAALDLFQSGGANWIWNEAPITTTDQITGQWVDFSQTLNVPGFPAAPAQLAITADNGFSASANGTLLGSSDLGPGFPNTLREDVGTYPGTMPQTGLWGVASQGWQIVHYYSFPVETGSNTLAITAANEYMSNGTSSSYGPVADYGLGWNGTGYTNSVSPDPLPTDTMCWNPGGLIFSAQVSYYAQGDTAWAGVGSGSFTFTGENNWATYFIYSPPSA